MYHFIQFEGFIHSSLVPRNVGGGGLMKPGESEA